MELRTARLLLRELEKPDIATLAHYTLDPLYQRYEPPLEPSVWHEILRWRSQKPREHFYLVLARHEAPAQALGCIYLSVRSWADQQAELGYMLGVAHWNQGYMTEAALALLNFGFAELKMHRIYAANIIAQNTGSRRVAIKCGMRLEARFRESIYHQERWWDGLTYAILAEEWAAFRAQPPD